MRIKSSITYQPKNQEWPSMLVQYFESWQEAFKETRKVINKMVRVKDATLLSVIFEDEDVS